MGCSLCGKGKGKVGESLQMGEGKLGLGARKMKTVHGGSSAHARCGGKCRLKRVTRQGRRNSAVHQPQARARARAAGKSVGSKNLPI